MDPRKKLRILSEETVRRPDLTSPASPAAPTSPAADDENPYWAQEEPEPHPDPSRGCIQRGLCCKSSPGWFAPGEADQAAALRGLSPDAFFRRYLVIEAVEVDGEKVEAFAPVKLGRDGEPLQKTGGRVDGWYRMFRGACIFYDGHGCGIYEARPLECRKYICTNEPAQNLSHEQIGRMWRAGAAPAEE